MRYVTMMNEQTAPVFQRTALLTGEEVLYRLAQLRVIIFGVGGVGSWCAESLIRSGVGHLTMVDPDCVDPTNINRQLPALATTVGRPKVEVMRERLLQINPTADVVARQDRYSADTEGSFCIQKFDYVIDAIDSMQDKLELILRSTTRTFTPVFYSSMGAARKTDPTQVRVSEFWKVDGCPLAASLRKRMRRAHRFPERKFQCVWSPERYDSSQPKGTLMPVTASFGLVLASLVVRSMLSFRN